MDTYYFDVRTENPIPSERGPPDAFGDFGAFGSAKWHAHPAKDAPLPAKEVPQTLQGVLAYRGRQALDSLPLEELLRDAKNAPDKPRAERDYVYALLDKMAAITELLREIPYRIPGQYSGFGATDEGLSYRQRQIDAPRSQVTLDLLRAVPSGKRAGTTYTPRRRRVVRDPGASDDPYRAYVEDLTLAEFYGLLAYLGSALPKIRRIVDVTETQASAIGAFASDTNYQATQGRELAPRFAVKEGRFAQGRNMYGRIAQWPAVQTDPKFGKRNPVKNFGIHIASGVWVCCGQSVSSGHPGCLIDRHNVRDNQSRPARFTLSPKDNPLATGKEWLASYRRGTAYLDVARYEDIHQRIEDAISAIHLDLLDAAVAAPNVETFFFVLGVKEVSRLIFMFRLIHQYNDYRQDEQEPAPVSSMEWARYIAKNVYGSPLSLDISGPPDERKVPGFDPRVMQAILDRRMPGPGAPGGGGGGPPPPGPGAPGSLGGGGRGGGLGGSGPPAGSSGPGTGGGSGGGGPAYDLGKRNAIKEAPATVSAILKNLEDARERIFKISASFAPTRASALSDFSGYIIDVYDILTRVNATETRISAAPVLTAELVSEAAADTEDALRTADNIRQAAQQRYNDESRLLADDPYQQFLVNVNNRRDEIKTAIENMASDADNAAAADPTLQSEVDAIKDELVVLESKVSEQLRDLGPRLFPGAIDLDKRLKDFLALVEAFRLRVASLLGTGKSAATVGPVATASAGGGGPFATASVGGGGGSVATATTVSKASAGGAAAAAAAPGFAVTTVPGTAVKTEPPPATPSKPTRPVSGTPGSSGKKGLVKSEPLPGYADRNADAPMVENGVLSDYGRRRLERARSLFLELDSLEEISVPTSKYNNAGVPDDKFIMWRVPAVKSAKKDSSASLPPSPTEFAYDVIREHGILPLLEAIFGPGRARRTFAYPPSAGTPLSFSDVQLEFLFGNPATAKKQVDQTSLAYKVMFLRQFENTVEGANFPSVFVSEWAPTSERAPINSKGYLAETGGNFDRKLFFVSTDANLRPKVAFIGRAWAAFISVLIQITSESGANATTLAELQQFVTADKRASNAVAAIDAAVDPTFGFVGLYSDKDPFDLEKMRKVASRVQDSIEAGLIETEENFLYGGPPIRHPEQDVLEQFAAIGAGSSESMALFRGVGRRGQIIEIGALASRMLNFETNQIYADFNDKGQTTEIRVESLRSFILSRFLALVPTYATRMRILPDRLKRLRLMDAEGEFLDFVTDVRTGPSDVYIGDLTVQQQIDLIHQWGLLAQEMALFKKKVEDEEKAKTAVPIAFTVESTKKGWLDWA